MKLIYSLALSVVLTFSATLAAKEIKPLYRLSSSTKMVTDLLIDGKTLYATTDGGIIDIFDIEKWEKTGAITLPDIKDFMGDLVPPKVFSIDKRGEKFVIVSKGESGFSNVHIYDGKELKQIIDAKREFFIKKGIFADDNRVLLGLLSSEIVLYDIVSNKVVYRRGIKERRSGGSAFSDMVLSEDMRTLATADESGEINLFNVEDFKHIKLLSGQNLDNIYKIDYKNGVIITAGQDRRCAVYKPDGSAYYISGEFLIYGAALSPSGKIGVFASTIESDLQVFNTQTKNKMALLKGHKATLTDFAFLNETQFFSAADEKDILFWDIAP